jgi:hypothetical protein
MVEGIELDENLRLRRGFALMGKLEITALGCQVSPEFVTRLALRQLRDAATVLPGLVRRMGSMNTTQLLLEMDKVKPLAVNGLNWAVAREGWSRAPGTFYFDRPNVVAFYKTISASPEGRVMGCHGYDVVAHARARRAGAGAPAGGAGAAGGDGEFALTLEQGVLDTNAEAVLTPTCGTVENAAELLAVGGEADEWVVLRGQGDERWADVSTDPDTRARIELDLAAGYAVVAPKKPVELDGRARPCWWRVDPATGETLGMGYEGRGVTWAEYVTGFMAFGITGGVACLLGTAFDSNGVSVKDGIICAIAGVVMGAIGLEAATLGAAAAAGGAAVLTGKAALMLAVEALASLGAGLSQNRDIPDD